MESRAECEFEQQHHQFNNITNNCFPLLPNNFFAAKLLVIIDSCLPQSFTSMLVSLLEPNASTYKHTWNVLSEKFSKCTRPAHTHKHNVNKSVENGRLNKKNNNKSTEYFEEKRDRKGENEGKEMEFSVGSIEHKKSLMVRHAERRFRRMHENTSRNYRWHSQKSAEFMEARQTDLRV